MVEAMRFEAKCVLRRLLSQGRVMTVRTYKTKRDVTFRLGVDGNLYRRRYVKGPVGMDDLAPYAPQSGFDGASSWWLTAQSLVGSRSPLPFYLYQVERVVSHQAVRLSDDHPTVHAVRTGVTEETKHLSQTVCGARLSEHSPIDVQQVVTCSRCLRSLRAREGGEEG